MASFAERMMGAAKLNVRTFEEVEADPTALRQAMGVVALSSIATGIGAVGLKGGPGLVGGIVGGLLGWAIWADVFHRHAYSPGATDACRLGPACADHRFCGRTRDHPGCRRCPRPDDPGVRDRESLDARGIRRGGTASA